jgi:uracil phosphoribosyltransferase
MSDQTAAVEEFPTLRVLDHPLIQHKLGWLRDRDTPKKLFMALVSEISMLMAYEVTRDLPLEDAHIETPMGPASVKRLRGKKLAVVPILRAGLGMVDGVLNLIPSARVGHVGLYRDEESLEPFEYYCKIPPAPELREFILLDPMLATGGSAAAAVSLLKERGAERVRFMCLVAAPEGVRRLSAAHPDVQIYAAALDSGLNERGYIDPGLGDAGDRLFGTR